jgi:target of EGR1 protein 1
LAFVQCDIRPAIPHKSNPITLKLHEMGLASKSNRPPLNTGKPFCEQYAYHGFCQDGDKCKRTHDLDIILDYELGPQLKKVRPVPNDPEKEVDKHISRQSEFTQTHSAAFDAFMTGFIFAYQLIAEENTLKDGRNRIYLIGKQIPLIIEKSRYTKVSKNHELKRQSML